MKIGQLYKHTNGRDVAIQPVEIRDKGDFLRLNVIYRNVGSEYQFVIDSEWISINKSELINWKKYKHV